MQRPGGTGASSRAVVNTNFLLNTVHGIGSHNRREEVEDCWRQRRLEQDDKQEKQGTRLANTISERRREVQYQKAPVEETAASVDDTRAFWAERKQRAMTATRAASSMEGALLSTLQTGTSGRSESKTKLGKVGCRDRDSSNFSNLGAKLLASDKQNKRKRKDQMKDKKDKADKKDKKKNKDKNKERRKRDGRDGRDVGSSNVEESQREQNLESDVVGAKRKKHKKRTSTSKDQKKHASAKRRREN